MISSLSMPRVIDRVALRKLITLSKNQYFPTVGNGTSTCLYLAL